ncbi:MAG: baseplate J/gp47 family protein [Prolixibacteraceae bacterium]|nr:baseplate J/gp47 family protein [Prolixibacteraceae bacterium]
MADCGKDILQAREGTNQLQRFIDALAPGTVKLNDFSLKEWMQFARRFAEHVNYFGLLDDKNPSTDWTSFFKDEDELEDFLKSVETGGIVTPHLALFASFVQLLEYSKNRFNKLTKRHLDFYYHNILQIEKLPATPDKVHLIFELAKNSLEEKIVDKTQLDGGKDASGKKRIYKTNGELIANKSVVSSLMSVYNDHKNQKLKAATVANSYDGIGGDFPDDDIKWWPFGYFGDSKYPELPDAKVGFALAAEILELQEGMRNVLIIAEFNSALQSFSASKLQENIVVYCTGEKGWLGPFEVVPSILDDDDNSIYFSGFSSGNKKLQLAFQIPKEEKPVAAWNEKAHGENFNTHLPVCRILIKTENTDGFKLYRNLIEKELKSLKISVDVRDIKSLSLESDIGTLNPEKPFYPFGTQPVKRSNFYIGYPELFKKTWKNVDVEINWKNTPEKIGTADAFVDQYFAYRTDYIYKANSTGFFTAMFVYIELDDIWQINPLPTNLIVKNNDHFKANVEIQNKEVWEPVEKDLVLFNENGELFQTTFSVPNVNYETDKNGPVRLSLNQSFLHELFPRIYALAFSSDDDDTLIPNEPYTPMVDTVRLNYTAESSVDLGSSKASFENNQVKLFHEFPFGQAEQHPYLKNQLDFISDKKIYLVPTYCKGGELYIGIENAENLQQVSLLVQVLEGSENPLAESFVGKQKAEWLVLCKNEWKDLNSDYMISNETDNFLKSGIVKFSIPRETTRDNTVLPSGFVWVKVKIHKTFDAVSKTIAIYAQAGLAEFSDNGNDLSHLEKGLEAETISKLIQRVSTIKSITQPFSSFGGAPEESDAAYYRRVSERLRHKNRAITLWDYEHIILQKFSEIHKVKCLNHSKTEIKNDKEVNSFLSPGNVLVVVIPDIVNKNVFDIYQPRVSQAKLNEIQDHVNLLNSMLVNAKVINPSYEEVTVDLKVKFHEGYDESYYLKVLNEDITRLLSPWAFEETASIDFGVVLHRSLIINYIEKLKYVDYVEDVKLLKGSEVSTNSVSPSCPKAILVSAKQHQLSIATKSCKTTVDTEEKCQI